jgi:hypothetical protein
LNYLVILGVQGAGPLSAIFFREDKEDEQHYSTA